MPWQLACRLSASVLAWLYQRVACHQGLLLWQCFCLLELHVLQISREVLWPLGLGTLEGRLPAHSAASIWACMQWGCDQA